MKLNELKKCANGNGTQVTAGIFVWIFKVNCKLGEIHDLCYFKAIQIQSMIALQIYLNKRIIAGTLVKGILQHPDERRKEKC